MRREPCSLTATQACLFSAKGCKVLARMGDILLLKAGTRCCTVQHAPLGLFEIVHPRWRDSMDGVVGRRWRSDTRGKGC